MRKEYVRHRQCKPDTGKMQRRRREREAGHVFDAVQRSRHFGAMRMAMKQRKQRQDSGTNGNR